MVYNRLIDAIVDVQPGESSLRYHNKHYNARAQPRCLRDSHVHRRSAHSTGTARRTARRGRRRCAAGSPAEPAHSRWATGYWPHIFPLSRSILYTVSNVNIEPRRRNYYV